MPLSILEKSRRTLELDKILTRLSAHAVSLPAQKISAALLPSSNLREIQLLLDETEAACQMALRKGAPSFFGIHDITVLMARAERGGLLTMGELLQVAMLIRSARNVQGYRLHDRAADPTCLDDRFFALHGDKELEQDISASILDENEMADTASDALLSIRRKIKTLQNRIRDLLSEMITNSGTNQYLQETIVTQRSGRFVLPVKAEHKNNLPGMVHDVSSSGATVFVEPLAVVNLNNDISILLGEEKQEIERILAAFSARVLAQRADLLSAFHLLVELDVIFARAKLAIELHAFKPALNSDGFFELRKARHPLLDPQSVVPVDITLGGAYHTLIVTGPNTGGKTVSLKTLGLLTLMAACGLHIPAAEGSAVSVVPAVFADIGDEQSIEQSLSTFSSHMTNIVEILSSASSNALVLFDELGAGTDPTEGAALAIAIIEAAAACGARVAATTHYAELKIYALNTPGVQNASCEFNLETLRPTYRLVTGVPGRSNAFAIARRLSLPESVIRHAASLLESESVRFETVIERLESDRQKMESALADAESSRRALSALAEQARTREAKLEAEKDRALRTAREEANALLDAARRETAGLLSELRALQAKLAAHVSDMETVDLNAVYADANTRLNEAGKRFRVEQKTDRSAQEAEFSKEDRALRVGDRVWIEKMGTDGVVSALGDPVTVQTGSLQTRVRQSALRLMLPKPDTPAARKAPGHSSPPRSAAGNAQAVASPAAAVSPRLDLRGQLPDEALYALDLYLDQAARAHLTEVTIVHGKGTGKLREAVTQHLRRNPQITSFRLGKYGEGETGVTIVTL